MKNHYADRETEQKSLCKQRNSIQKLLQEIYDSPIEDHFEVIKTLKDREPIGINVELMQKKGARNIL